MTRTRWWIVVAALAVGAPVLAQPAPKGAPKAAPKAAAPKKIGELPAASATLSGANADEAAAVALGLGADARPAAHEALLDALAMGLTAQVATPALQGLAQHPAPPDVVALRRYATHRDPIVRSAALGVLALYPSPDAHAAIVAGLHDMTPAVRAAAAAAAAKGRVKDAIDPLFKLLARGEEPAARALAALADADLARKIGDQLGQVPDGVLAICLGGVLKRPDFGPDPARVEIVRAIAKISGPEAVSALTDYLEATPKNPPRPSRAEAQKVVDARLGGGK
jgi:HEAT repeat protein